MIRSLIHNLSALFIAAVILTGTASAGGTEEIGIKAKLTVHLYTSMSELRREYVERGGEQKLMHRVKGFYSDRDNSIHCVKWDYYTCGH
ncbi:MAG: hypothetical protein OEU95_05285, partial [Nitrospirota bacterium]|nr:hypothetical protein [Nitrospirota bacterium]